MSSSSPDTAKLEERTQNQQSSIDKMADAVMTLSGDVRVLTSKVDDMREAQKGYLSRREFENAQDSVWREFRDVRKDVEDNATNKADQASLDRLWTMFWGLSGFILLTALGYIIYNLTGYSA